MRLFVLLLLLLVSTSARAATVTGRVVQDGFRVAEYVVFADPALPTSVNDGDGRFTLYGVEPGRRRITIAGWAFARREIDIVIPEAATTFAVGTITVERGRVLSGRVVDASGMLVEGATVAVYETRPDITASEAALIARGAQVTTSRHDGTFTVNGLPESVEGLHVMAFGEDLASPERTLERHTWDVELPIGRLGTISGRVTNRSRMSSPIVAARPAGFAGKPILAGVDPSGRFSLDVPAGVYDLAFLDEPIAAPLQVVVVADRTRKVTVTAPTSHVTLEVASKDCMYVRLLGARPGAKQARTEVAFETCANDRALFTRVPPGLYRACVDTEDEAACHVLQVGRGPVVRARFDGASALAGTSASH